MGNMQNLWDCSVNMGSSSSSSSTRLAPVQFLKEPIFLLALLPYPYSIKIKFTWASRNKWVGFVRNKEWEKPYKNPSRKKQTNLVIYSPIKSNPEENFPFSFFYFLNLMVAFGSSSLQSARTGIAKRCRFRIKERYKVSRPCSLGALEPNICIRFGPNLLAEFGCNTCGLVSRVRNNE